MALDLTGLRATFRTALTDAGEALDAEMGATVTLYTLAETRDADGGVTRAWTAGTTGVAMRLKLLTNEAARRAYGQETAVTARGQTTGRTITPRTTALKVTTARDGFPVGASYVVAAAIPSDAGNSVTVGLEPLPTGESLP